MQWFSRILIVLAILTAVCLALVLWVRYTTAPFIYMSGEAAAPAQAAIVLGASIISTSTLSGVLEERAEEAVALYKAGKVTKILVTGDDSAVTHDEVDPVGRYLEAQGVKPEDVFLDHAGFDTYSSMYRAKAVFGVTSALIVSQSFHLPRAVFLARSLGLDAYGVPAGQGDLFNRAREVPATLKALFDIAIHRIPQYLGPLIPIEGSGTSTQPALNGK